MNLNYINLFSALSNLFNKLKSQLYTTINNVNNVITANIHTANTINTTPLSQQPNSNTIKKTPTRFVLTPKKAADAKRIFGITKNKHPYRYNRLTGNLINGEVVDNVFLKEFSEEEFISCIESTIEYLWLLSDSTIISGYKVKGVHTKENRDFEKKVKDSGNRVIYIWGVRKGEVLYIGQSKDAVDRIGKYRNAFENQLVIKENRLLQSGVFCFGYENVVSFAITVPNVSRRGFTITEYELINAFNTASNQLRNTNNINLKAFEVPAVYVYYNGSCLFKANTVTQAALALHISENTILKNIDTGNRIKNCIQLYSWFKNSNPRFVMAEDVINFLADYSTYWVQFQGVYAANDPHPVYVVDHDDNMSCKHYLSINCAARELSFLLKKKITSGSVKNRLKEIDLLENRFSIHSGRLPFNQHQS